MVSDNDLFIVFARPDQIFEGNTHYDTPELRHFDEVVAQYIRLYPERWSPAGIGMRVEILGCDLPGRSACCFLVMLYECTLVKGVHQKDEFHIRYCMYENYKSLTGVKRDAPSCLKMNGDHLAERQQSSPLQCYFFFFVTTET